MYDERAFLMTLFAIRQAPRYARRSVDERLLAYRRSSLRLPRFASLAVVDNHRFSVLPHLLVLECSERFDVVDTTQSMDEILEEILYPVYADAVWHDRTVLPFYGFNHKICGFLGPVSDQAWIFQL